MKRVEPRDTRYDDVKQRASGKLDTGYTGYLIFPNFPEEVYHILSEEARLPENSRYSYDGHRRELYVERYYRNQDDQRTTGFWKIMSCKLYNANWQGRMCVSSLGPSIQLVILSPDVGYRPTTSGTHTVVMEIDVFPTATKLGLLNLANWPRLGNVQLCFVVKLVRNPSSITIELWGQLEVPFILGPAIKIQTAVIAPDNHAGLSCGVEKS
ncbi:hypothetical protein N7532_006007 [Penicillium argentinense]|uniref:Uncharacterized protein n=1 Tax=Penicillium argentinense TaxID=1131581 RepID=A0A9W9FF35_9EURO|nr:uncharacterized protein N7532_006007 [Penicillium argentinense]KAJ5099006.1 hypothetical protein N7532_006007 [Penicillium argentinense]